MRAGDFVENNQKSIAFFLNPLFIALVNDDQKQANVLLAKGEDPFISSNRGVTLPVFFNEIGRQDIADMFTTPKYSDSMIVRVGDEYYGFAACFTIDGVERDFYRSLDGKYIGIGKDGFHFAFDKNEADVLVPREQVMVSMLDKSSYPIKKTVPVYLQLTVLKEASKIENPAKGVGYGL